MAIANTEVMDSGLAPGGAATDDDFMCGNVAHGIGKYHRRISESGMMLHRALWAAWRVAVIAGNGQGVHHTFLVIPGRAAWRGPGIHTHDGGYGFRACRFASPRNDGVIFAIAPVRCGVLDQRVHRTVNVYLSPSPEPRLS